MDYSVSAMQASRIADQIYRDMNDKKYAEALELANLLVTCARELRIDVMQKCNEENVPY
jgi:hypothetical protein